MKRSAARLLILLAGLHAGLAAGAERIRLFVAGAEQDAQMQMARDLARHVGRPAEIDFDIRSVAGTPEALQRLGDSGTLQFALLQADVADAYGRAARRGNGEASRLLEPVRVVAPLHEEEIHFVVRRDSPLNHMHDLAGARINLGPLRSGTALTAANLYRLMFDAAIPDGRASFLPHEEALLKLISEQSLDAVAIVAPRPVKLLANMKPEARQFVKLLKFDATHPGATAVLGVYGAATTAASSYPSLLEADQPTLAVRIHLVAAGQGKRSDALLARFAAAWCKHLERLKAAEPARWESVNPVLPGLATGWAYARSFEREVRACQSGEKAPPAPCELEDRSLGLCE